MAAKFGPGGNSNAFRAAGFRSTFDAPQFVADNDLDAYEYEAGQGISATHETLAAIGEQAKRYGIQLSLHTPYFISLSSVEADKRRRSIYYLYQSAVACEALGATIMVVHSGSAAKLPRAEAIRYAEDTLRMADDMLAEHHFSVKLGLETMGKQNQLGTLDEVIHLCKLSPRFAPVVDFGHINAREQGILKTEDDFKAIFDRIATELGAKAAEELHCHFSRIEYTAKGERKHLTFADETYGPDHRPLLRAVAALGVSPTFISESAGTQSEDARTMKEYYQSL